MTEIQKYLQRPRAVPFQRGLSDCIALVFRWAEEVMGSEVRGVLNDPELTGLKILRAAKKVGGLMALGQKMLIQHGWVLKHGPPADGEIVLGWHPQAFGGLFVGLWSAGSAVTVHSNGGLVLVRPDEIGQMQTWRFVK